MSGLTEGEPGARPHPNSYPVPGTRLWAGEYPGDYPARSERARDKIRRYLDAGITCFVDLTREEDGLDAYEAVLGEEAAARRAAVTYHRHRVPDNGVPTPERMREILDTIDAATTAGQTVYVHCWGGVGRTGTVVGCYLVRRGMRGEEALRQVGEWFGTMSPEKVHRHRATGSPQTEAQRAFVRSWTEPRQVRGLARDRVRGALVGLATGDAVGTTLEFAAPGSFPPITDMAGGGPFGLEPGQWTDDTSMALCLAESLVECGGFDPRDQMQRYVRWSDEGHLSSTGRCFDIGMTTAAALRRFVRTGDPFAGSTDPQRAGNGSLMRLAPIAMFFADDPDRAIHDAAASSRTTHAAPVAVDACRYLAALLVGCVPRCRQGRVIPARSAEA